MDRHCPICGKNLGGFDLAYLRENGSCMDCDTEENEERITEIMSTRQK